MIPRTKYQKLVVALAERLRPTLPERVVRWAMRHATPSVAYRLPSGKTTCLHCGHIQMLDEGVDKCRCPHCRAMLKVHNTSERTLKGYSYFSYITTVMGLQVVRTFRLCYKFSKNKKPECDYQEVCQYWINAKGKHEVIGRRRITNGIYYDTFCYKRPMELRADTEVFRLIADNFVYPKMRVLPEFERNGFYGEIGNIAPVTLFRRLLTDHRIETLMKHRQLEGIDYFFNHESALDECWASYKVAHRNHYAISDFSMWVDLLKLLSKMGKDTLNPHYICPADLQAEHDRWLCKVLERKRREDEDKQRKKAMEEQQNFVEMKGKFFGIEIKDELLTISVLDSVMAHFDEGNALHHCVGKNGYYKQPYALILSARIDGQRIETVEFSLTSWRVQQSRGLCNKSTQYHDRIVSLVNSNAHLFARRMAV